mmetsp:Transcript_1832/g.1273  ORF Transcript_1832/g.1273 Transcript_1832/m.1273 type:complete len:247 (+) Transcript_1832:442-1182(+)|eukprot:CAMPEP_0201282352 /NCGR_PEP_ID=MMETSP1317-20130820/5382_1 /ASSEMBLY_ACC=CAM_ASM_000770 /TAXON_ID=187299 /ORGANISM="Undescribed Undescribed, Strain Undescribed" /LENGTH=246 /DNA_ID=CAMNT_0047594699 /DNA_START=388 /DNA_END=1128 /DNA_ORIENTATION=+
MRKSGVCHNAYNNDIEALAAMRKLFSFLPLAAGKPLPILPTTDPADREIPVLDHIVPEDPNKPYDIRHVMRLVCDDEDFEEIHPEYAKNVVIGFGRFDGKTAGLVGNQPNTLAGVLDIKSSCKAARFVRFCDAFDIPIISFVDVPGFMPGTEQEFNGIISNGAKLIYAYSEMTAPKITFITRKAYGGAYCVMSSKHLRGDTNYSWPSGEIAVMGAKGAVEIIFKGKDIEAEIKKYELAFANPLRAA